MVLLIFYGTITANAAFVTLQPTEKLVVSDEVFSHQIWSMGECYADSERDVYFDVKYWNGVDWIKDSGYSLAPNTRTAQNEWSNDRQANLTWRMWLNTWAALFSGGHASAMVGGKLG